MVRKKWRDKGRTDPAARDLVRLAEMGWIDFEEIRRPTRFRKFRVECNPDHGGEAKP
ncbi:hypothetical protein [Thermococcus sp. JdF3]|uniref:hypothetical protein n=1 Tax=Thermococcus sp. JdF3 TaxID=1638258 RepID=UPI001438DDE3|nr:hypothetical protein [Thermococcus sp. JdF3]